MVLPSPENAKGWIQTLLAITDKATSVTLLLILVIGSLIAWYMLGELRRVREVNGELWQQLITAEKAKLDLALRCDCAPRGEETP